LATGSGLSPDQWPAEADDLIAESGRLPLALSLIAAMLRGKPRSSWKRILGHLREADLARIKADFPDYPHTDLLRAIEVSVNDLDETARERYLALAVLLEDMPVSRPVQQMLWKVEEEEAEETAERFVSLSLAQRDAQDERAIRLHDLQLDYTRAQFPDREHPDREQLELIHGAVRLSSNVIARDPWQFVSQLVGRLGPYASSPVIQKYLHTIVEGAAAPWLRPLWPSLSPPGMGLLRTLEGHSDRVNGVAVTADGRRAVSASWDNTLKVWDLDTGSCLATFTCDAHVFCCTFASERKILAGDAIGRLHLLQLEIPRNRR
jgi:WD domain, G-beta repeat